MQGARDASTDDLDPIAHTLARAFADDPLAIWMFGRGSGARLRWFRFVAACGLERGRVTTLPGHGAAAIWSPPGVSLISGERAAEARALIAELLGSRRDVALAALGDARAVEAPEAPHVYLFSLGTDPAKRRAGLASAVLEPALAHADALGRPVHLETASPASAAFYRRHGFAQRNDWEIRAAGPVLRRMRRAPACRAETRARIAERAPQPTAR